MVKDKLFGLRDHKVHRYVFNQEKYLKDFLEGVLSLIDESVAINTLVVGVEHFISAESYKTKESYSDVLAIINDDTIILIELYNTFKEEQNDKSNVYSSKIFSNQITTNEEYKDIKKVININLIRNSVYYEPEIINEYKFMHTVSLVAYEKYFNSKILKRVDIMLDTI